MFKVIVKSDSESVRLICYAKRNIEQNIMSDIQNEHILTSFEIRYYHLLFVVQQNPLPNISAAGGFIVVICWCYFFSVKNVFASFEAVTVFCIRVAIVIGPTPPGTGVMYEVRGITLS